MHLCVPTRWSWRRELQEASGALSGLWRGLTVPMGQVCDGAKWPGGRPRWRSSGSHGESDDLAGLPPRRRLATHRECHRRAEGCPAP